MKIEITNMEEFQSKLLNAIYTTLIEETNLIHDESIPKEEKLTALNMLLGGLEENEEFEKCTKVKELINDIN